MRILLALLGFLALAMAPVAAPLAAMSVPADQCRTMTMSSHHHDRDHRSPHGDMQSGCCLAVPAMLPSGLESTNRRLLPEMNYAQAVSAL
ncbi:MAG: hypothetical protein ACJ8EQ_05715, partial [Sphingomicrobium sp.]